MVKHNKYVAKILFLVPYPEGESPSQRFRFEQYYQILEKAGFQYQVQSFWDVKTWKILYQPGQKIRKGLGFISGIFRRLKILTILLKFDFVFIHRETIPLGPPWLEWLIVLMQKKIIYDFDDAIWLPNTSEENELAATLKWHRKVNTICTWSYRISCGNLYLCDYAFKFNRNVAYNPTTIDTDHVHNPVLFPRETSTGIVIGWTGSHSTLPYLESITPLLNELTDLYPMVSILVIADRPPESGLKNLIFKKWSLETEIRDLAMMDIGIMPLPDDPWTRGKCGFKALQYMAMEIPTVASPVGINTTIIDHGINGFLASTTEEWKKLLEKLILSPELRISVGKEGREKVTRNYSVRSNSASFLALFT